MTTFTQEQNMTFEESAPTMLEEFAMPLLDLQKWLIALKVPADQVAQQNAQLIQLAKVIDDLEHVEAPSESDEDDDESEDDESEDDESEDDESEDESEDDEDTCNEGDEEGEEEIWFSIVEHE